MAYFVTIPVACTNRLCSYEGITQVANSSRMKEKVVCPRYGFKTLADAMKTEVLSLMAKNAKEGLVI